MSLVNASFFVGDINIPNTSETNISNKINYLIKKYETDLLDKLLGVSLSEALKTENSSRITSLKNGAIYFNDNGVKMRWEGLVHDENISLVADYIWLKYIESNVTKTTSKTPAAKMKTEGGETVSPAEVYVIVQRGFSKSVQGLCNFLWSNKIIYSEVSACEINNALKFSEPINMLGI